MMEIVRTFDLPNIKLLAIKFDDEPLDASEVILSQWSSAEFLRVFLLIIIMTILVHMGEVILQDL